MKKSLFLVAAAALTLASCNNDVKIDENTALVGSNAQKEIAFAPLAKKPNRAISNTHHGYINGTNFDTDWALTASAYQVAPVYATPAPEFFAATDFAYSNTSNLWEGDPHRYWPLSPVQVNFLAIAHANANNTTGVTWTTSNASGGTHKVEVALADNYAKTAQYDFLYAIGNGQVTQEGNVLSFPAKVDMEFKHTQSYLVFNVKAADAASCGIHITDLKLKGIYTAGTATIERVNPNTYADPNVNLTWASRAYPGSPASDEFRSVTADQSAIDYTLTTDLEEKGHLLIIPNVTNNTVGHNGTVTLQIAYTLNGKAYTYEYEITDDEYKPGFKYIYNITFQLHEIRIDATVADWNADINGNTHVDDDVNILIPSVPYDEAGANVSIGATEGTYTFSLSGVPANGGSTYSVVEADAASDNLDFVDGAVTLVDNSTSDGTITFTFKSTGGADGKKHLLKLKLGDDVKMTITLTLETTI